MKRCILFSSLFLIVTSLQAQLYEDLVIVQFFKVDKIVLQHKIKSIKLDFFSDNEPDLNSSAVIEYDKGSKAISLELVMTDSNKIKVSRQITNNLLITKMSGTELAFYLHARRFGKILFEWPPTYDLIKKHKKRLNYQITKEYTVKKDSSIEVKTKLNGSQIDSKKYNDPYVTKVFWSNEAIEGQVQVYVDTLNYRFLNAMIDSSNNSIRQYDRFPEDGKPDLIFTYDSKGNLINKKRLNVAKKIRGKFQEVLEDTEFKYNQENLLIEELYFEDSVFYWKKSYSYTFF